MNKNLAHIFKGKLTNLPFADLLCGMVQTLTTDDPIGEEGATVQKREPVTYDHNQDACAGKEIRLIPESRRKSIIYFEDFGISVVDKVHGDTKFNSALRLVCWLNRGKTVGNIYSEVGGAAQALIIAKLANLNPYNSGIFTRIITQVARLQPQDAGIFGRYTYKETDRQYLRPPFEYFAIDLTTTFFVPAKCLEDIQWDQEICF